MFPSPSSAGTALLDEMLSGGLQALSASTTGEDLERRFLDLMQRHFDPATVDLHRRTTGHTEWINVSGDETSPSTIFPEPGSAGGGTVELGGEGTLLLGALRLNDTYEIALHVTHPGGAETYTDGDVIALRLCLALYNAAFQALQSRKHEKELIFTLNQRLLQLNSLIDTGIDISTLDDSISLWSLALERAVAVTNASKGSATILRDETVIEKTWFPPGWEKENPNLEDGISVDFEFQGLRYLFALAEKESRRGIVEFDGTDRLLLDALARQVHASLENRFLLKQSLDKQRMEQDFAVAASIQQRILPETLPEIAGYDAAGINIPSKSVGGDYYDCIRLQDGKIALVIADVAGKGIPAALLVSSLHAYLSVYIESGLPLVDVVRRINAKIHRASTDDKFITAFVAVLDPGTGTLDSVSAGHNAVYLRSADGSVTELSKGGIPLGMLDLDLPYESERHVLQPGDRLLLYTDGIPEAQDASNELYETGTPLKEFVRTFVPDDAQTFIQSLIEDVQKFTGDAPQADDITALYILRR